MVGGINSGDLTNINSLQILRAANAFKTINKPLKDNAIEDQITEIEDKVTLDSINKDIKIQSTTQKINLHGINSEKMSEIKNLAGQIGDKSITDEDISYGLKYGRSVLVDFSA